MAFEILFAKIVFILGITNVISLILVLLSCRCTLKGFSEKLWKYNWYKKFYNYHCYYWWVFIASVILHAFFAIMTYGIPF